MHTSRFFRAAAAAFVSVVVHFPVVARVRFVDK
jgi:hypothetical protein